jgi:hypothetical protein
MIRKHAEDYHPPFEGGPSLLAALCLFVGVAVAIAGSVALLLRCVTWLVR